MSTIETDMANKIIEADVADVEMKDLEETDEEVQADVKSILKKIGRIELEDLVVKKIVECVNSKTEMSEMRKKYLHLCQLKDKLFQKSIILQKQVEDLSGALKLYAENAAKAPPEKKPTPPLRFYRSVGLQVHVDTSTRNAIPLPNITINNGPRMTTNHGPRMANSNTVALTKQLSICPADVNRLTISGLRRINKPPNMTGSLKSPFTFKVPPLPVQRQLGQLAILPRNPTVRPPIHALKAGPATATGKAPASSGLIFFPADTNRSGGVIPNQKRTSPGMEHVSMQQSGNGRQILAGQAQLSGSSQVVSPPSILQQQQQQPQQQVVPPPRRILMTKPPIPNPRNRKQEEVEVGQKANEATLPAPPVFVMPDLPAPTSPKVIQQRSKPIKDVPPKPFVMAQEKDGKLLLSWTHDILVNHAEIQSYQMFACQQVLFPTKAVRPPAWKPVGEVDALPLPMNCTLSQFSDENRYHFIVRGLDVYNRSGEFSEIVSIYLRNSQ